MREIGSWEGDGEGLGLREVEGVMDGDRDGDGSWRIWGLPE